MGLLAFVIFCFVVVLIAWAAVWCLNYFMPGHPVIVDRIIWGLSIFIIVFKLLQVTGILSHDPVIPRV
jgi:hypothetical protein